MQSIISKSSRTTSIIKPLGNNIISGINLSGLKYQLVDLISKDALNLLTIGSDDKLYISDNNIDVDYLAYYLLAKN